MQIILENMKWKSHWCSLVLCIGIASHLILYAQCMKLKGMPTKPAAPGSPVKLTVTKEQVVMDNGILALTLSNPDGALNMIQYKGGETNLLEPVMYPDGRRGYWDIVWSRSTGKPGILDMLEGGLFKVIGQSDDKVEISFSRIWDPSVESNGLPLNYDKRYIMLRGSSGFYSYGIFEHLAGWPELHLEEARIALKLNQKLFNIMIVSDTIQRIMPSEADFEKGKILAYQEARQLLNPVNPHLRGQVEDKYEYAADGIDSFVHGWVNAHGTGFWVITPSDEFRCGGPIKTELTSHAGPTALAIFFSGHYIGEDVRVHIEKGKSWKKVFGPIFFYLNSNGDSRMLWDDAKRQMREEINKWPYDFPMSPDFTQVSQRGAVYGRLMVHDGNMAPANSAYIGLAVPGLAGSWQLDSEGYQFWTRSDPQGFFNIRNIRPGIYNVYAYVTGVIGDYKYDKNIEIKPGCNITLGDLVFNPPRSGPTLWEIGIPDRTAAEFFIPDGAPGLTNELFINHPEKWRQYGLWDRYTDLYPNGDLIYTIGTSDYKKDWFFAQVNRRAAPGKYVPTTWKIKFPLTNVRGIYTLRIALASATYAQLQVRVNDPSKPEPLFTTTHFNLGGRDNAIARHGIHGLYWLYQVDIPASNFVNGPNTIFIRQQTAGSPFNGVMYDYLRLEGPSR